MSADIRSLYQAHIESLTERARAALAAAEFDGVVIHSGRMVRKSSFDDQDWPFVPCPMFAHWAPLPWPDCALALRSDGAPRLLVSRSNSIWEHPREPDWSLITAGLEIEEVDTKAMVTQLLAAPRTALITHDAEPGWKAESINPDALMRGLEDTRVKKTPYEVECIREANRIAAQGHRAIRQAFEANESSELVLHLAYLLATDQDDSETPYKSIVATGRNAAVLHHIAYKRDGADEVGSLLVDAGATCRGYPSDITRTWARGDSAPAGRFAELIERMHALQQELLGNIRVGERYEALHDRSHEKLGALLAETGIGQGSAEALVEKGVTRAFFPHGLGHSLGIQVHDVGCRRRAPRPENPFLRNTSDVAAGQVFTVEPGLYFIDGLLEPLKSGPDAGLIDWTAVEALAPFGGIRIEDNIHVLEDGIENLTRPLLDEAFDISQT